MEQEEDEDEKVEEEEEEGRDRDGNSGEGAAVRRRYPDATRRTGSVAFARSRVRACVRTCVRASERAGVRAGERALQRTNARMVKGHEGGRGREGIAGVAASPRRSGFESSGSLARVPEDARSSAARAGAGRRIEGRCN